MQLLKTSNFFKKTLLTIAAVSLTFQLLMVALFAYYMLIPLGKRATDDLSSVILHAAERWEVLNTEEKNKFKQQMLSKHDLILTTDIIEIDNSSSILPYILLLEKSLKNQLNKNIDIKESFDEKNKSWFWVDIPTNDKLLRFGFSRARIGVNPPIVFIVISVFGLLLVLLTSAYIALKVVKPVDRLYNASKSIGKANWPDPIPLEGPNEIQVLTRQFNEMSLQIQELLSNRTVLLSGIAHDLRTPLTQINLALSMLPNNGGDAKLMSSIEQDLNNIDKLISEALNVGAELTNEEKKPSRIIDELRSIIDGISVGTSINIKEIYSNSCTMILYPLAFKRIITNLLTNAIRYGNNKPITIVLECNNQFITIKIKDQGNGIPNEFNEKVFQPFYRLEKSRNSVTGGSGLGLAIARQLAHSHDWKIKITPRKKQGTIASLIIPR